MRLPGAPGGTAAVRDGQELAGTAQLSEFSTFTTFRNGIPPPAAWHPTDPLHDIALLQINQGRSSNHRKANKG